MGGKSFTVKAGEWVFFWDGVLKSRCKLQEDGRDRQRLEYLKRSPVKIQHFFLSEESQGRGLPLIGEQKLHTSRRNVTARNRRGRKPLLPLLKSKVSQETVEVRDRREGGSKVR